MRRLAALVVAALVLATHPAPAQDAGLTYTERGPRFLLATSPAARVDVAKTPALRQRISLELDGVPLGEALRAVSEKAGVHLAFSNAVLPRGRTVQFRADSITVAAALTELLLDAQVDILFSQDGRGVLVRRQDGVGMAGTVTGRVTDAATGQPIGGVELRVADTRLAATADDGGQYVIRNVPPGEQRVTARQIGYRPQTQTVTVLDGEAATLDFALVAQPTRLDEVVTTVTGEQRLRELGHVVGRINADSLVKEAPVSNLSELLNGRVPGLQVFQQQGTVGGQVRLQVRGFNTLLLNTEPIVIIDGVRYATTQREPLATFLRAEPTSRLNDLNPNDIESIEIVKGPSAATLYGTDAANGVIVITTKRGRPGPARWNAYAKGTSTAIPAQQYPDLWWGYSSAVFGSPDLASSLSCTLDWMAAGFCTQDSVGVLSNPLGDPELSVLGNKPRWEYGANVAGGRQDLRYYFSGDYEDATGPVQLPPALAEQLKAQRGLDELPEEWRTPNTLSKLNLRANVSALFGETADLRVNTGYVRSAIRSLTRDGTNAYVNGAFARGPTSPYQATDVNPVEAFAQTSTERADRFFGSASGQWRPTSWLSTRATIGLDLTSRNRYSLVRRGDVPSDALSRDGLVEDERARQLATTAELGATATARHGRLSTRTAVGVQYVRNLNDLLYARGRSLPPGGSSVGEAASLFSQQTYAETATLGGYVEETLGWNERLFLTGALRLDGASSFGRDYDAVAYPKVSASWLVSEEPFLPRVPGLDELRLRYAYGASGQQPTSAMARPLFGATQMAQNGTVTTVMRLFDLGSPDLRPERVREHEFGFDATVLQNRVQLGLTWYRRRTVDQIARVPLPPGLGNTYTNLGLTTQRGFEAELTARVLDTRLVSWDVTVQHGLHRTTLVDLGDGFAVERRTEHGGWVEGYPLGARFQSPVLGYADANGDGIIALDEVQRGDTAVYMGESTPPESQTLTTVVGLFGRRVRLSALLERRSGFTQINAVGCGAQDGCRAKVDPSTPLAEQARAVVGSLPEPADFTRLREVTAALDLPTNLARALRVRSATLAVSVRNLALWSDFSGPDPESAAMGEASLLRLPVSGGVANGIPQGRSWTFRLDLGL